MENTITDFFRMVWEQNSKVIVMATDLTENGVEKCGKFGFQFHVTHYFHSNLFLSRVFTSVRGFGQLSNVWRLPGNMICKFLCNLLLIIMILQSR
jgi:protein tyrosine phosphatase